MTNVNPTKPQRRTIAINEDYRIIFLDADNIGIERIVTVDPTKSPAFDPEKHDAVIRTEWRSTGKHYATVPKALTGLLELSIRSGTAVTLRQLLGEVQAFRAHIDELLGIGEGIDEALGEHYEDLAREAEEYAND